MSSLSRKKKKELYTETVNSRVVKIDRPSRSHESTLPIKEPKQVEELVRYCKFLIRKAKGEFQEYIAYRNYIMVVLGLNTALRAEDLLQLKARSIRTKRFWITENKTQKQQDFFLSKEVQNEVEDYIFKYHIEDNEYLFQSRTQVNDVAGPITRKQAWAIMKNFGKHIGITYSFGLHSLRKTFGYQYVKQSSNKMEALLNLQYMYNHSTIAVTQLYICWDKDDVEKSRENIAIGIKRKN